MVARIDLELPRRAGFVALALLSAACQLVGGFEDHTLATEGAGGAGASTGAGATSTGGAGATGNAGATGGDGATGGEAATGGAGGTPTTVGCGNGIQEPNEACDDGANESGDGCSATCDVECEGTDTMLHPNTSHCYLYSPMIQLSWFDASEVCASWHGTLAAVTSFDEMAFLLEAYGHDTSSWIGGRAEGGSIQYEWETGEPFSFAPWEAGSPTPGACTVFTAQGAWYTYDCAFVGKPFFCERATGLGGN